jgi:CRISPR-associated protein Csm1
MGGIERRDYITNEEIRKGEKVFRIDDDDHKVIKASTHRQIKLGRELKDAVLLLKTNEPLNLKGYEPFRMPCSDSYYYLLDDAALLKNVSVSGDAVFYNNQDIFHLPFNGNLSVQYAYYGGNIYPVHPSGQPKTFDELCETDETKLLRLGVLRMDVDNLGSLFITGLGKEHLTFSTYSALSRNLDFFFKGYLNSIWQNDQRFKAHTYIIYSGGDDLFIVGKWDILLEMSRSIRVAFNNWVCQNSELSLSGGLSVVTPRFPISKAAVMAEKAEKAAKNHSYGPSEKNAISFFNYPLNWDHEFAMVQEMKDDITKAVSNEVVKRSFLHKLMVYDRMRGEQTKTGQNETWRWLLAYDFGRITERERNNIGLRDFVGQLKIDVYADTYKGKKHQSKYTTLELLALAARWAELSLRN